MWNPFIDEEGSLFPDTHDHTFDLRRPPRFSKECWQLVLAGALPLARAGQRSNVASNLCGPLESRALSLWLAEFIAACYPGSESTLLRRARSTPSWLLRSWTRVRPKGNPCQTSCPRYKRPYNCTHGSKIHTINYKLEPSGAKYALLLGNQARTVPKMLRLDSKQHVEPIASLSCRLQPQSGRNRNSARLLHQALDKRDVFQ